MAVFSFASASGILASVLPYLPERIGRALLALPADLQDKIEEIRLRRGRPAMIHFGGDDLVLSEAGRPLVVEEKEILFTLQQAGNSSLYAYEEEIRNGFLTITGGHRLGLVGQVAVEGGKIKTLRHPGGLNLRLVRELPGVGEPVLPYLLEDVGGGQRQVRSGLIISPPQAGKTTLLRDLARLLSSGLVQAGWRGVKVGLVDERSELAACYQGVPQRDVGLRTDVLDGCPKAEGIMLLLRSMSPAVIVVDEIGRPNDVAAIEEAINAGVALLATAHGKDLEDLRRRPMFRELLVAGVFQRYIILSRRLGPGTLEAVLDENGRPLAPFNGRREWWSNMAGPNGGGGEPK